MYKAMSFPLLLRGFVVLGVMLMHTTWYFSHAHAESWVTISEMLLDIISLFAVPLVMFVSGYMFISHNRHADYYKWSFFRRMFLSVLSPYLLFSLLYLGGAWFFSNASFTLKQAAYLIVTGSSAVHMAFSVRYLVFMLSTRCCCVILTVAVCITGCIALLFR